MRELRNCKSVQKVLSAILNWDLIFLTVYVICFLDIRGWKEDCLQSFTCNCLCYIPWETWPLNMYSVKIIIFDHNLISSLCWKDPYLNVIEWSEQNHYRYQGLTEVTIYQVCQYEIHFDSKFIKFRICVNLWICELLENLLCEYEYLHILLVVSTP